MSREPFFDPRTHLKSGVHKLAKAVGSTLGPLGNNVAIAKPNRSPEIVHDGVSVAKVIHLKNKYEDMGAQLVKEASTKTNDITGDGTTTATILADYLVSYGIGLLDKGTSAMKLRKGMQMACDSLVARIKEASIPVTNIKQVATISAQDEEVGELIEQAFKKVKKNGVVTAEEGQGVSMSLDHKNGFVFDEGWASPYFVNTDKNTTEISDCHVLLTDEKITSLLPLKDVLSTFITKSKNLLIISDQIEGEALASLIVNKVKGSLNVVVVRAPEFGDRRQALLEDLAHLTGATLLSAKTGHKLESATVDDFGFVKKVNVTEESTTLIGSEVDLTDYVTQLKNNLKTITHDLDKQFLEERIGKLTTGVAIINVGATTQVEMKEKKERVIDAISATKAALEEGILPGGAISYSQLWSDIKIEDSQIQAGIDLVKEAIQEPFNVLMKNSGLEKKRPTKLGRGIDVMTGEEKDMVEAGIIDPAKVVRVALQNAVSVASSILTTNTLIPNEEEAKT